MNNYEYKNEELKLTCKYSLENEADIAQVHQEHMESLGEGGIAQKVTELKEVFLNSETVLYGIFNHHIEYAEYEGEVEEGDDEYSLQKKIAREYLEKESFDTTISFNETTPSFVKMSNLYFTLYSPLTESWELEWPNYEID